MTVWKDGRPEDIFEDGYNAYGQKLRQSIILMLEARKPEIVEWMQSNAKWVDRTGAARRGLAVDIAPLADGILLSFMHGVTYGVYLESIGTGKWAILTPAIDYFGPIILQDLQELLK